MRISDWSSDVCSSDLGDLPQRVEAAEIDQNDIDDVGPAASRVGVLDKKAGNAVRRRPGHHGVGYRRNAEAGRHRDDEVAPAPEPCRRDPEAVDIDQLEAFRPPAQPEQEEDSRYDLDEKLRQGEVGCGEIGRESRRERVWQAGWISGG